VTLAGRRDLVARVTESAARAASRAARARAVAAAIRDSNPYRWVGVYDVLPDEIVVLGWSGPGPPAHPRFPRARGLNGRAVAARTTVVVQDVASDSGYLETFGDTQAELVVPVLAAEDVVGTIDVESAALGAFRAADIALLEACARAACRLWLAP
jgi:L-methionine (R)-S-oxide reductase